MSTIFKSSLASRETNHDANIIKSRYPGIPDLDMTLYHSMRVSTGHRGWNYSTAVRDPRKTHYQVSGVSIAHWSIASSSSSPPSSSSSSSSSAPSCLIIGACPVPCKTEQYPFSNNKYLEKQTRTLLTTLTQDHHITAYMSLMAECDDENGTTSSPFRPYSKVDLPIVNPSAKFYKLGIKDCNVTKDEDILAFVDQAIHLLQSGERVYLHCWGGHGRAGTVNCLILCRVYGMSASDALDYCQFIHDCRASHIDVASPQTLVQATQVRRICDYMIAQEALIQEKALLQAERDALKQALEGEAFIQAEQEAFDREAFIQAEQAVTDRILSGHISVSRGLNEGQRHASQESKVSDEEDILVEIEYEEEFYGDFDEYDDDEYDEADKYDDLADEFENTVFISSGASSGSISPYSQKAVRAKVRAYRNDV